MHERATRRRGGRGSVGAARGGGRGSVGAAKRGGSRGGSRFVHAEAAVRDAGGLQGVEGDTMQSRQRGRVVVQGEGRRRKMRL